MSLHPLNTTTDIREAYLRYLKTIKPFQDEWLRDEFAQAIEEPDMLVKGPLVEISLPFQQGSSIKNLVEEGVLSARAAVPAQREVVLSLEETGSYREETDPREVACGRQAVQGTGMDLRSSEQCQSL